MALLFLVACGEPRADRPAEETNSRGHRPELVWDAPSASTDEAASEEDRDLADALVYDCETSCHRPGEPCGDRCSGGCPELLRQLGTLYGEDGRRRVLRERLDDEEVARKIDVLYRAIFHSNEPYRDGLAEASRRRRRDPRVGLGEDGEGASGVE